MDNTNVGVVNHAHFGSLTLHSGHKYYATVTGIYLFIHSSVYDAICVFSKTLLNFFQDMILLEEKPVKLLSLSLWISRPLLSLMSQSNLKVVDTLYQQPKFLFGNILKPF